MPAWAMSEMPISPPGIERRGGHALGRLAHRDAVQHRIERAPGLDPDEPGHVGAEYRRPRRGEHQQHRDREGADIEALEDDLQQRHPGLGLAPDGPVGRDGLGLGPRLGIGAERGRVAGLGRPLLAGVVDGIEHHLLAHDRAGRARRADEEVVGGRQRRHQLRARQRVGGGAGEEPPAEYRPRALKLGRPLRIEARRAGLAGDDLALQRGGPGPRRRPPGRELEHARGRGAGGRAAGSGDQRPDVGRFAQIVRRDVPEQ